MKPKQLSAKIGTISTRIVLLAFCLMFAPAPLSNAGPASGHTLSESPAPEPSGQATLDTDLTGQSAMLIEGSRAHLPDGFRPPEEGEGVNFSLAGLKAPEAGGKLLQPVSSPKLAPTSGEPSVAMQMGTDMEAALATLTITADGSAISLTPPFDPDTTYYEATVNSSPVNMRATKTDGSEGITSSTSSAGTGTFNPPSASVGLQETPAEGAITDVFFTVQATDGVTTRTYQVALSRPAMPEIPDVTIESSRSEYVAGLGILGFTITRTGGAADELDLTLDVLQQQQWLVDGPFMVTLPAGELQSTYSIPANDFSTDVTQSGTLTVTVEPVAGYDMSGARARVKIISQEGPAVQVSLSQPAYTFSEGDGKVTIQLEARAAPGVPYVPEFLVALSTKVITTDSPADFVGRSTNVRFLSSGFLMKDGVLVGTATDAVEIVDDNDHEENEQFGLELASSLGSSQEVGRLGPDGSLCGLICTDLYLVTIVDNDSPPALALSVSNSRIEEPSSSTSTVTISSINEGTSFEDRPITVTFGGPATYGLDYLVGPDDTDAADGHQITLEAGEKSVSLTVTAINDSLSEPCEWIIVGARSDGDGQIVHGLERIAILDFGGSTPGDNVPLTVGLTGIQTGAIEDSDSRSRSHSFSATSGQTYIIEVKHPLAFTAIDDAGVGGDAMYVPGYLVDPSILEVLDDQGAQVLGEVASGGFVQNWARAIFTPSRTGDYVIVIGAGPQDRTAQGCYSITVRADDHADDYRTKPGVAIQPGESIGGIIDSDVAPNDPGLNPWDWKITPPLRTGVPGDDVVRPRRGIESLDDRDVFRFEISEAGEYQLSVSDGPTGVGIWFIWDRNGNFVAWSDTEPEVSMVISLEPGAYFAEIGTPFTSSGNTGSYTFAVAETLN